MTQTLENIELYCVECGYDLRQLDSERCPECGAPYDRSLLGQSVIPWRQRARIGGIRAFWKTVWLVMFRPQRLALEMNRPASFPDALKFRRIVAALAMLIVAPATVFAAYQLAQEYSGASLFARSDAIGSAVSAIVMLCLLAGDWAFLLMAAGVASYFFHPSSLTIERQNRAVSLSYYACAPMALAPLVAVALVPGVVQRALNLRPSMPLLIFEFVCILGVPLLLALSIWRTPMRVLNVTTRCGVERQLSLGAFLPVAWILLAGLTLVVAPLAVAVLMAMALSFGL